MRNILFAFVLLLSTASAAFADSPHFLSASVSINDAGALACTFSEAGLGNTLTTEMWKESDNKIVFRTKVEERDVVVLSNAAVELNS